METVLLIVSIGAIVGNFVSYRYGYKKGWNDGGTRVLNEWKAWNDQYYEEDD